MLSRQYMSAAVLPGFVTLFKGMMLAAGACSFCGLIEIRVRRKLLLLYLHSSYPIYAPG
jgi:hypothetical protein